ncbi:MAG: dihydroorotate dehydrogenase-like protein [Chloroflexia bacterium]|nr:dihydroorotate dehydrogenase-like protein [Chloroflexia bacterium]
MADLKTTYLGLELKNPVIVSSSGLTNSIDKIKKLEKNGAGAIVIKSIFEEQINHETSSLLKHNNYPEAGDYILNYAKSNTIETYLELVKDAKEQVKIPIIVSVNCVSADDWISFTKTLEEAGADAVELNIHIIVADQELKSADVEQRYYDILKEVRKNTKIPIAVKIGNHFSNLSNFVSRLYAHGANGVVLFNRFYEPDIDIEAMQFTNSEVFSNPSDIRHSLRWVGMLSDLVETVDISASTGVHDSKAAIKMLLAGARTVQVCSTLYKNGVEELNKIVSGISEWMDKKGYENVADIRGLMSYKEIPNPSVYERAQFMKYFSSVE